MKVRKLLAMLLALTLILSCVPVFALADGPAPAPSVAGTYTSGNLRLTLNDEGSFSMKDGTKEAVEGTFTTVKKTQFTPGVGLSFITAVVLDETNAKALAKAGSIDCWYMYITLEGESFKLTKDVSMALIDKVSHGEDYDIVTAKNDASKTGYTTTITVADRGYEKVDAFGDWSAVDASDKFHNPDTWAPGMEYCSSSILPLVKNGTNWELQVNLASSVMGVICYHDVNDADLDPNALKPQKISFNVPYDAKQAPSLDWSPAFPAEENNHPAGTVNSDVEVPVGEEMLDISVYTPNGYSSTRKTPYPVVYLIPGGGSDYMAWFNDGKIGNIFDNLTAEGLVEPTILVSMERTDVNGDDGRSYLNNIITYVEANYNVYTDAAHRALVGVSMGSLAATNLWRANPEQFGYYGFLSGADKAKFDIDATDDYTYETLTDDYVDQLSQAIYFLGGGTTDFNMYVGDNNSASVTDLDAWMDYYGIPHNQYSEDDGYQVTAGDHNWPIWIKLMMTFAADYLWENTTEEPSTPVKPVEPEMPSVPIVISGSSTFKCNGGTACPSYPFKDVDTSKWYHEPIDFVVERGLMNGMSSTTFAPNSSLTRGMLVTILYRYEGEPAAAGQNPFTDVADGKYYTDAVIWAAANGIVNGITETTFQPDTPVTREQMVTILYRYAQYKGVSVKSQSTLYNFYDADSVSSYARDAFGWAVYEGIIQGDNYNLRPKSTATRAEVAAVLQRYIQNVIEGSGGALILDSSWLTPASPTLTVTSDIFGQGDTGGKTTLKNILLYAPGPGDQTIRYSDPETGERLDYPQDAVIDQEPVSYTGSAILSLNIKNVDDRLIDSSRATVRLVAGDGYYPEELVLKANKLTGQWRNGQLEYTLNEGDLEWYIGDYRYEDEDNNSGREWSILGGDGNGCYTFNLEVSGITYGGVPVAPATFQVRVYIWGRTGTDLAPKTEKLVIGEAVNHLPSGVAQSSQTQWAWVGAKGDFMGAKAKPVLCDNLQDDFFIIWPNGSNDASGLSAEDVTVTLYNQYGVSYELKNTQYEVFSSERETQVAVTFHHAAFTPVFTTMTIDVNGDGLQASKTYDIASVYAYMVQQGGGGATEDGVCTAYSYYGYEGLSIANASATYTLKIGTGETAKYYAEDGNGNGYLVSAVENGTDFSGNPTYGAPDTAKVYDAMGPSECDVQFIVNTLFVKTRILNTEVEKTVSVDGESEEITFTKEYESGQISNWSGVTLAPGYVRTTGFSPNQQWAWSQYYGSGWSPELSIIPKDFPYTDFPFGNYADRYKVSAGPGGGAGIDGPGPDGSGGEVLAPIG